MNGNTKVYDDEISVPYSTTSTRLRSYSILLARLRHKKDIKERLGKVSVQGGLQPSSEPRPVSMTELNGARQAHFFSPRHESVGKGNTLSSVSLPIQCGVSFIGFKLHIAQTADLHGYRAMILQEIIPYILLYRVCRFFIPPSAVDQGQIIIFIYHNL